MRFDLIDETDWGFLASRFKCRNMKVNDAVWRSHCVKSTCLHIPE